MKAFREKYKKPLLFVLGLLPVALVGGYFTGVYGWAELTNARLEFQSKNSE